MVYCGDLREEVWCVRGEADTYRDRLEGLKKQIAELERERELQETAVREFERLAEELDAYRREKGFRVGLVREVAEKCKAAERYADIMEEYLFGHEGCAVMTHLETIRYGMGLEMRRNENRISDLKADLSHTREALFDREMQEGRRRGETEMI